MEQKKQTPPYLSKTKLAELFNILATRNIGKLTSEELGNYGFGRADASFALVALRFLKLIDEQGQATDLVAKLKLRGDAQREGAKTIVQNAYTDLFKRVDAPYQLSSDELYNEFLNVYEISPRIARTAVPAFMWLCEFSGFIEGSAGVSEIKQSSVKKTATKRAVKPMKRIEQSSQQHVIQPTTLHAEDQIELPFSGGIKLILPRRQLRGITFTSNAYRAVADAITDLATMLEKESHPTKEVNLGVDEVKALQS